MLDLDIRLILTFCFLCVTCIAQKINYLDGLSQHESCKLQSGQIGTCTKISNCYKEFERFTKNKTVLNICQFKDSPFATIICCPNEKSQKKSNLLDLTDFKTCRREFLPHRRNITNIGVSVTVALYGKLVKKGDRPNMAAIGIDYKNSTKFYFCGGSIITTRFIVTAAHCKFYKGQIPNIVRVGDRYLFTKEDDDIAQQLTISKFITHEKYTSKYAYNDIALVKTVESIIFSNFVVPSCIADLDAERIGSDSEWTVAGYGETEDQVQSNVLLELYVDKVKNFECNEFYSGYNNLPHGILDSQICVKSKPDERNQKGEYPDTCFGDSGSPLQYKTTYYDLPDDFNIAYATALPYIPSAYITSNVIGIVSFGVSCGFNIPSVYTKLSYYRDWMSETIEGNSDC